MSRITRILKRLSEILDIQEISIIDESSKHAGHYGLQDSTTSEETHLKISITSKSFEGLSRIQMHQKVNDALKTEFNDGLHALTLNLKAPKY